MPYPTKLLYPERVTELVLAQAAGSGDILGYSSGWLIADADAATNIYGQYMALQAGAIGQKITACKKCLLEDEDAPFTANTAYYLSGTAGGYTATRPSTNGDVVQVIGRSLDITRMLVDIKSPQEFEMFIRPGTFNALGADGTIEAHAIDAGWEGPNADSAAIAGYIESRLPFGLVSLSAAQLVFDMKAAGALDIDFSIVATYKGGANNAIATAIIEQATEQTAADNKLLTVSVLAAFDATVALPGMFFSGKVDPDGGDAILVGLYIRGFKL